MNRASNSRSATTRDESMVSRYNTPAIMHILRGSSIDRMVRYCRNVSQDCTVTTNNDCRIATAWTRDFSSACSSRLSRHCFTYFYLQKLHTSCRFNGSEAGRQGVSACNCSSALELHDWPNCTEIKPAKATPRLRVGRMCVSIFPSTARSTFPAVNPAETSERYR